MDKSGNYIFFAEYDKELFRPVPGHRQYVVNCDGSIVRRIMSERFIKTEFIRQNFVATNGKQYPNGYYRVMIETYDDKNIYGHVVDQGYYRTVGVHRLVALAWIGVPEAENNWVNHKDGNKINNHYLNLEWGTVAHNIQHAWNMGLCKPAEGIGHWNYGKHHSEQTRQLMSQAKIGAKHPKFKGWYCKDGVRYGSAQLGAIAHNTYAKKVYRYSLQFIDGWSFIPV